MRDPDQPLDGDEQDEASTQEQLPVFRMSPRPSQDGEESAQVADAQVEDSGDETSIDENSHYHEADSGHGQESDDEERDLSDDDGDDTGVELDVPELEPVVLSRDGAAFEGAGTLPAEQDAGEMPVLEDIEEALVEQPVERVPPLILMSAVVGLVVGLFVWGSLAVSVLSSAEGVVRDLSDSESAFGVEAADMVLDCEDGEAPGFLTPAQRAAFQEQCVSPTPAAVEQTPRPDPDLNRADCDAIRGTAYRSVEEREWFLENCLEG